MKPDLEGIWAETQHLHSFAYLKANTACQTADAMAHYGHSFPLYMHCMLSQLVRVSGYRDEDTDYLFEINSKVAIYKECPQKYVVFLHPPGPLPLSAFIRIWIYHSYSVDVCNSMVLANATYQNPLKSSSRKDLFSNNQ